MGIQSGPSVPSRIVSTYFVFLRRPWGLADRRNDPFWEFGSFGRTGCHAKNLLHPQRSPLRDGDRLAFLQGGPNEIRIVALTPPLRIFPFRDAIEARWDRRYRPFRLADAPLLINNRGRTDVPGVLPLLRGGHRSTNCGQAASQFRSRTKCMSPQLARQILACHDARTGTRATRYIDAVELPGMPWHRHALGCGWHVRTARTERFPRVDADRSTRPVGPGSEHLTKRKPRMSSHQC